MRATLDGGRLTVAADGASLKDVLAELARVAGIEIHVEPSLAARVAEERATLAFQAPTLEDGLRRLLREKSFVLEYSAARLAVVRIYEGGGVGSAGFRRADGEPWPAVAEASPDSARLRAEALQSPDPSERARALDQLAAVADADLALETALTVLQREGDPDVLVKAVQIVGAQETVPLEPLITFAMTDAPPAPRIHALELLFEHGNRDPRVRQTLANLAQTDSQEEIRQSAESLRQDLLSE